MPATSAQWHPPWHPGGRVAGAKRVMPSLKLALGCAAGGVLGYVLAKLFDSQKGKVKGGALTIGYWKIRGLAAPLRMMCCYAGQPFVNKAYGDDAKTAWFGSEKKRLKKANALIKQLLLE